MPDNNQQLSFFDDQHTDEPDEAEERPQRDEPELRLHASTPLTHALGLYIEWLKRSGSSKYTVKAFRSDIGLLMRWAGEGQPVGDISTGDLNNFLHWMVNDRGKPCSPKTYSRRVTALKNFFGFLYEEEAIKRDPSNAVIQKSVQSPLPTVLNDEQVERMLTTTDEMRRAEKPDTRPYFLVSLLLQSGIKKSECMRLKPHDFIRSGFNAPGLWVHYDSPKMRYKERTISTDWELIETLDEYLAQRTPEEVVFDCTGRNLEYVLRDTAEAAHVPHTVVSFEALRWTCALQDYRDRMEAEEQRIKMGLSEVAYRQTRRKLAKLAFKMGYTVNPEDEDDDN